MALPGLPSGRGPYHARSRAGAGRPAGASRGPRSKRAPEVHLHLHEITAEDLTVNIGVRCGAGPVCEPAGRELAGRGVRGRLRRGADVPARPGRQRGSWSGSVSLTPSTAGHDDGRGCAGKRPARLEACPSCWTPAAPSPPQRTRRPRGTGKHSRSWQQPARLALARACLPPLGRLGAGLDQVARHRVVTVTMRALLHGVAGGDHQPRADGGPLPPETGRWPLRRPCRLGVPRR